MKRQTGTNSPVGGSSAGFTLIEVIIALAILTIGILAVNAMQTVSVRGNATASGITTSANWAADRIEQINGAAYDDALVNDTDADGTSQDPNLDSVDDSGGNFGLDDAKPTVAADITTADHTWTSPDGIYTILWNVAPDYPMPNVKTIHVIVQRSDRGTAKSVTLRYKKAKYM